MKIADFGAGSGHLALACSPHVGHTGHVYAIEVQKELVLRLESELKSKSVRNVSCIWGDIEKSGGSKLASASVDVVIISNVLFQAEDKIGVVDEAKRVLKKRGRVLVIEQNTRELSPKRVEELFTKRGFTFVENIMPSEKSYGIIFKYE
jgi:ubiquinone/menaquinone biosynthesis C-methylase UbiE